MDKEIYMMIATDKTSEMVLSSSKAPINLTLINIKIKQ